MWRALISGSFFDFQRDDKHDVMDEAGLKITIYEDA